MPVEWGKSSGYAKERQKWEATHTEFGPGQRPHEYRSYPTMMYKAERRAGQRGMLPGLVANDDHEQRNLESRGYVIGGQQAAMDALEREERAHATLAAEINHDARHGMGDGARAEVEEAQAAAGMRHLPVIPETPKRKRGRPSKADLVAQQ